MFINWFNCYSFSCGYCILAKQLRQALSYTFNNLLQNEDIVIKTRPIQSAPFSCCIFYVGLIVMLKLNQLLVNVNLTNT